jgi:diadenosine tetraphosphate (Ap4A) HIT family hydrolase
VPPSILLADRNDCIFCHLDREILVENEFAVAVYDRFPVSPGHSLVIPRRHAVMIWDLADDEYDACFRLVRALKPILEAGHKPDGFNVGVNCGATAGQSVWHAHIHVIPRFPGDSADPLGGVRHVIPRKK